MHCHLKITVEKWLAALSTAVVNFIYAFETRSCMGLFWKFLRTDDQSQNVKAKKAFSTLYSNERCQQFGPPERSYHNQPHPKQKAAKWGGKAPRSSCVDKEGTCQKQRLVVWTSATQEKKPVRVGQRSSNDQTRANKHGQVSEGICLFPLIPFILPQRT